MSRRMSFARNAGAEHDRSCTVRYLPTNRFNRGLRIPAMNWNGGQSRLNLLYAQLCYTSLRGSNVRQSPLRVRTTERPAQQMSYQRVTRLAIMLSPRRGDTRTDLGRSLVSLREPIGTLFGPGTHVRIGTRCESDPLNRSMGEGRASASVEAAIEITGADGTQDKLAAGAGDLGRLLLPLIDASQAALTVGPTYRIVKPQDGAVFLSLSFMRHPGTSVAEFRHWWLTQHAQVATPLLPELLAYDQVHVDHDLSKRASEAAGLPYVPYDSYDNLSWESAEAFVRSTSDPQATRTMYEDEVGHIDHRTYRGALMDRIASYETVAS
jgi:hypothetical protein